MNATRLMLYCLIILLAGCLIGCVGPFSAADRAAMDQHAAVMRATADRVAQSTPADIAANATFFAVILENEARAAENVAEGFHFRGPKWTTPATRPTTLPWNNKE